MTATMIMIARERRGQAGKVLRSRHAYQIQHGLNLILNCHHSEIECKLLYFTTQRPTLCVLFEPVNPVAPVMSCPHSLSALSVFKHLPVLTSHSLMFLSAAAGCRFDYSDPATLSYLCASGVTSARTGQKQPTILDWYVPVIF